MSKKYWLVIGAIIILLSIGGYLAWKQNRIQQISNFEECVQAGYPVMESYPPKCATPDGRTFTQQIEISSPNPISSPSEDGGQFCIQVITPAKDPQTGECKEFPTPCDVPSGWEKVDRC